MTLTERAEALEKTFREWLAVCEAAVPGPWLVGIGRIPAFITLSRTAFPALIHAALEEVEEAKLWARRYEVCGWPNVPFGSGCRLYERRARAEAIIERWEKVTQGEGAENVE
jgi:hypothetical protein